MQTLNVPIFLNLFLSNVSILPNVSMFPILIPNWKKLDSNPAYIALSLPETIFWYVLNTYKMGLYGTYLKKRFS